MYNTKKISITILFVLLFTISSKAQFWNIVWADEFNMATIDTNNWTMETGAGGWGNNELQYYTNRAANATIINGQLVIIGKKENYLGSNYTSARMITKGKQRWKYGKIEARIRVPKGQGIWPAFWMLGDNFSSVGWPKCGEIDIMEHINSNDEIHGTMHWDINGHNYYGGSTTLNDVTQYHVYSVEWNAAGIKWFVDGTQYWSGNTLNNINNTEEFHAPFFIILNMAIGGNWPGYPNPNTLINDTLWVDYVRVYENGLAPTSQTEHSPNTNNIRIYPNPINKDDVLNINFKTSGQYNFILSDLLGKIHYYGDRQITNSQNEGYQLPLKNIPPGSYVLSIKNKLEIQTFKIVVTN